MSEADNSPVQVPFRDALKFWIKLGFISFGGPAGQIAIMHKELVERRKWISEESFLHALNFCMLLPGPEAQQLAAYNGWRLHGVKGGIAAGAFFVIPSIFFLLALSYIYARFGHVSEIVAVLDGFKPVVVAIVVEAVLKIGKRSLKTTVHFAVAVLSFVAVQFFYVPFPLIVVAALVFGLFWSRGQNTESGPAQTKAANGKPYLLKVATACLLLWAVPFVVASAVFGFENIAVRLYLFFTQAAFVTFGGAYAVLAYVNQAAVSAGWITAVQAVDGLALAETTPGPLIMVLQFVGFMAAFRDAGGLPPMLAGTLGGLIATWVTFTPCFLWIFLGAPYMEKLRGNQALSAALSAITAAVVGVILNLAVWFALHVLFGEVRVFRLGPASLDVPVPATLDLAALALTAFAVVAVFYFKLGIMPVLAASGGLGMLYHLATAGI
jgi:chromate transporter